jgi:hypothetical protein
MQNVKREKRLLVSRCLYALVCAWHVHELMGLKSPVWEPNVIEE